MLSRFAARQVTLKQNGGGYAIDGSFSFLSAHVSGDEQIFCRFGRQPLIPEDKRDGQSLLQRGGKIPHGQDGRAFPTVQLQRKSENDLPDLMGIDEGDNVRHVTIQRASLEGFQRLCRPAQFIAQRNADSLGPIIQRQYPWSSHNITAGARVRPSQRPFPTRHRALKSLSRRLGPFPDVPLPSRRPLPPSP